MSCPTHANGRNVGQPCDPAAPMQAISAILNPDTVGRGSGEEKVLISQSLENRTVGLDSISFKDKNVNEQKDGKDGVVGYYANPAKFVPTLRPGSKLISTVFNDIVHVYGIHEQTGRISQFSPVFSHVTKEKGTPVEFNNIAACSNPKDDGKGYLYFQMKDTDGQYWIHEINLSIPGSSPSQVEGTSEATKGTDIIAFHDGRARWILYQKTNPGRGGGSKEIILRNVEDEEQHRSMPGSSGCFSESLQLARIAVANARTPANQDDQVFVYVIGQKNRIYRSYATITKGMPEFEAFKPLAQATYVNDYTSMSVVADPANEENLIFAMPEKGDGISLQRDPWGKQ
ncbi:wall-associated ase precursor [Fusarium circinatum]|uniref:Wall-associated ase n=1 Tax=Fusarium circinatum TaxID=48490 RepID=A0A8H5T4N6_FUSCI|nr:wall-associated ase precursor [Fusarium circinatum]